MSEKITAMIEEIKGLTVLELSELVHALEDTFGVSAAAVAAGPAVAAAEVVEEKTEFDVVMTSFGAEKIKVIKEVRGIRKTPRLSRPSSKALAPLSSSSNFIGKRRSVRRRRLADLLLPAFPVFS